ncbi:hypothetical protein Tco_0063614, partial [Tanacetum coccineum]
TPPAFFKTVREMEHEQLFAEFNVSAARNLSLSSEVRMCAEYNILEKRRWKSLAEEKDNLLQVKDKEIEDLRSQLLQAKVESMEVARLRTRVSSLRAIEGSLRGEVASAKEHNGLLEQERGSLKLKVTSLESIIAEKDPYNPSAEADFNSVVRDLRGLDFSLLRELFAKKDASTWDVMDLLRLDDAVAEVLGMTDLQPDVGQLMVPVHYKQDKVVIGSQALSVALETCHHHPIFIEALAILPETSTEPLVTTLVTTALSTMVIRPNPDPFLLVWFRRMLFRERS